MIDGLSNSDVVIGATGAAVAAILSAMIPIGRRIADSAFGLCFTERVVECVCCGDGKDAV